MAELKIRVGCSVDHDLSKAYEPLIVAANRAAAAIAAAGKKGGDNLASSTKKATKDAEARFHELAKEVGAVPKAMAPGTAAVVKFGKDAEASFRSTAHAHSAMARQVEQDLARMERAQRRAAQEARPGNSAAVQVARARASRGGSSFGGAASFGAGMAAGAVRSAIGIAGDIARGAGVQVDIGHMVEKNSDLETLATKISNSGYMAGDRRNGVRIDQRELTEQAFKVGTSTGTDANVALEGLDKFVAKTGDLQTGRDLLQQMAVLSKATGASLADMMDASGDVSSVLGDVANKGELVHSVMRSIAAQGKLGAVEIKDLSKQMAKVAANSTMFTGDRVEVMKDMGALVQAARGKGGAVSASQAATSLGSFTNVFAKGARLDKFAAHGVQVYGADKQVRRPIEIIKDALRATGGDNRAFHEMFADAASQKVTRPFETAFKDAGGGEAGIIAVQKAFDDLRNATIADEEVARSFATAMKQTQSQTEVFNQQMRESAMQMQQQLTPAMLALAPAVVDATRSLAKTVEYLTGDKQLRNITDKANLDVPEAIGSTEKQLKGGKISMAQKDLNRIAEAEARERFSRASDEYEKTKAEEDEAHHGKATPNQMLARKFDALFHTDTSGDQASDEKVAAKKADLEEARKSFQAMLSENAKVSELLASGRVRVIVDNPPTGGKPALSSPSDGVEPPPGSRE